MRPIILVLLILTFSCVEKNPGTSILTSNIFNKATFTVEGQNASGRTITLGEHLLTEPAKVLLVEVYNGTDYPYTNLNLTFSATDDQSTSTNFLPTTEGEVEFPGQGGTCSKTLAPGKRCSIIIEVNPRESRTFNEVLNLSYKQFVEKEEHVAILNFLAGMPASLTFTNDKTQYIFGTPAGPNSLPVVERADQGRFQETIEIINAGGLSAKDLKLTLDESCISTLTSDCPPGMFGAYRFEHNCPLSLPPGQTCQGTIFYQPLNKNPDVGVTPDNIKEISYRGTVTARYETDSTGRSAALNAYFNSVSTDIQAKFTTTNAVINFDQPVVSGNRDTRFITIRNVGYRTGYLHFLSINDSDSNLIANCYKGDTQYLNCLDSDQNSVPLTTLPFRIKDRNNCLSTPDEKLELNVSQSCIFDFYFQPSVTFLTNKPTEFQNLEVENTYDALWKSQETILTEKLSKLHANSVSAGQIIIEKIRFNGVDFYTSEDGLPALADLKRMTLQSPNYAIFKNFLVTFKNIGNTAVNNITLSDGSGRNIPIGGSGSTIGAKAPYYFKTVIASDSTCTVIEPNGMCTLSMMFAPIGMDSNEEEDLNMFDQLSPAPKVKKFKMTYSSGSLYTDGNIDSVADFPKQNTEAHLTAQLVRKGMLMTLTDDNRNIANFGNQSVSLKDEVHSYIYLRNIGTGPVSYIQHLNPPAPIGANPNHDWSFISTPNPQDLGAEYDCLNIVDTDLLVPTNANALPENRIGKFAPLPKEESCVYTLRVKYSDRAKRVNAEFCASEPTNTEEAARLFYQGGGSDLWEICRNFSNTQRDMRFRYFDGDLENDARDNLLYGSKFNLADYKLAAQLSWTKKLIFKDFAPLFTATVYRPGFTLPDLGVGGPDAGAQVIDEKWFYGSGTYFYNLFPDPAVINPFFKGGYSRIPLQGTSHWADRNNYDYIYFMGTFPQNSGNLSVTTSAYNAGVGNLKVLGFTQSSSGMGGTGLTLNAGTPVFPLNLSGTTPIPNFNFTLNTTTAGEHARVIEYDMETGEYDGIVKFYKSSTPTNLGDLTPKTRKIKVLFLANVLTTASHPKLTLGVEDFDVTQNDGAPPTEVVQPLETKNLSWNYNAALATLVFDSVKLNVAAGPNDSYAKKRLTITNNTTHPIYDLRYHYRLYSTSTATSLLSTQFTVLSGAATTCTQGRTLLPTESCIITYRYQPRISDVNQNAQLTFMYRSTNNEYFAENIGLSLMPRSPGNIVAVGKTKQTINYKSTPTSSSVARDSYNLPFAETALSALPTIISFDKASGASAKITLENKEETKTSLLLSYQQYLTKNNLRGYSSGNPADSGVIPDVYFTRDDGLEYSPIYESKYPNNTQRIIVEASKGCLFGDDENNGAILPHQKGFNKNSVAPCYLRIALSANFDYLNRSITNINADDMYENAFELWYYTVNRSSTSSIWFHLTGKVIPDPSNVAGVYGNVEALENRTVAFTNPTFTPKTPSLGGVTGIRVYMTDTKNMLNNLYLAPGSKYFDIRSPEDGKWWANFSSNLANGQYFFFKAAAIRYHPSFTHTATRFPGLLPGEYVSQAAASTILELVVPPIGYYYLPGNRVLLEKSIPGGISAFTWQEASDKCTKRTQISLKNPGTIKKSYKLMDLASWELAKVIPTAHSYTPHLGVAHWLSNNAVSIDAELGPLPDFNPNSDSQMMEAHKIFYFRSSTNRFNSARRVAGGIPSTAVLDWNSLVAPEITFGNARCMIQLD